ncbi:protein THEM6-like [Helicoverpa zea]|uniref:protein THEM6-like n=1 Tax=Helicoverpa zea TaxID=7113 RepID=UPI001F5AA6DC|nr:protein THEM6-like [Helicoverpa zea]
MYIYIVLVFIFLNVVCDINYLIRTLISVLTGRLYQRKYSLDETTTIYGICTFQDCDISFKHIRIARLLRDLDFARYHFYERTGIYRRSRELGIKSLQGCTLTITDDPVPLFGLYKIDTKLVYWDDRSLFLEHEVITLRDGKIRSKLLSRQHAIGKNGESTEALLANLPGSQVQPICPEYIKHWLQSMQITSKKLKKDVLTNK